MKDITVFYTDGENKFETCVTCETVEEAIGYTESELQKSDGAYKVLEEETRERFEIDNM